MITFSKNKYKNKRSILISLTKKYKKSIEQILVLEYGFNINKCGFCDNYAKIDLNLEETESSFILKNVSYPHHNYCKSRECPGKKINPMSRKFIKITRNLTDFEVDEYLSNKSNSGVNTLRKNGFFEDKSNNPYSKEYWLKRGIDGDAKIKERTEKSFNTLRKNGFFEDKSNNPYSKEYWLKLGLTHREAQHKINEKNHVKPEFWQKLGYSIKESKILARKSANTTSKSAFIKRYGKNVGTAKYLECTNKMKKHWTIDGICEVHKVPKSEAKLILQSKIKQSILNFKHCKYSKESFNLFNSIIYDFPLHLKNMCKYGDNEYGQYDKMNSCYYFYDFMIPNLKICIEYHGTAYHPKYMTEDWNQPFTNKSSKEVYEHDQRKRELLEKKGYIYYTIWSDSINDIEIEKIKSNIIKKYNEYYG